MSAGISIITAIHNSLAVNRLYWDALRQNTSSPFELIIVDNHSTDGSERFFAELARTVREPGRRVIYVRNEANQSYPASQNQGMKSASYDVLCFMNNDVWVPRGWHQPLEEAVRENPLLVVSPSGQEAQPTQSASERLKRRWKEVTLLSRIWKTLLIKTEEERLKKSVEWMYGDLDQFRSPTERWDQNYFHGIKGDTVVFNRALLEILPRVWHERIEAADWHLYLTLARMHEQDPSVPLPRVLLESYVHHFGRYSARQKFEPLRLKEPFISIEEFWGAETVRRLWWGHHLPA